MTDKWRLEDPIDSCRALVEFISRDSFRESTQAVRRALFEDLAFKAQGIKTSDKAAFLAQGMYYLLPRALRKQFSTDDLRLNELGRLPAKRRKDVGIITVLQVELDAVMEVFGVKNESRVDTDTFSYWFAEVDRLDGSVLSLVVSNVGEPRNVPCAIAVDHMLSHFSVNLLTLVGIAAGPQEKVTLGDVVSADRVYDYEHVRAEIIRGIKKERPRPFSIEIEQNVKLDLGAYNHTLSLERLHAVLGSVEPSLLPNEVFKPKFHRGTIAAGEKLIADGSLSDMREIDDKIRAADQEDSGFAQACKFRKIPWSIFRGISDYGDPTKNDGWHFVASLAAASSAYTFLEQAYRPRRDIEPTL